VDQPTIDPVDQPTIDPVDQPTIDPVDQPTIDQVDQPTIDQVDQPTIDQVNQPTIDPVDQPTIDTFDFRSGSLKHIFPCKYRLNDFPSIWLRNRSTIVFTTSCPSLTENLSNDRVAVVGLLISGPEQSNEPPQLKGLVPGSSSGI